MVQRKYLFPGVIELNLQAAQSFGVNIYLLDGGTEWALIDVGQNDTLDDVIELIRKLDFPLSKCKILIATHADADHVQALKAARDRLKAKTGAHPEAAKALEAGDAVQTYASIPAQGFEIEGGMPPCKIDVKLKEGDVIKVGNLRLTVWHTPGHTPGQLSFRLGNLLFSGDNIYKETGASGRSTRTTAPTCRTSWPRSPGSGTTTRSSCSRATARFFGRTRRFCKMPSTG
jgi:hydroxyacylglutathione hydrolase